jgi:hypothetical protein
VPDLTVRSDEDDIYTWEKAKKDDWILRDVDVAVTDLGGRLGVKTVIVCPPLICELTYLLPACCGSLIPDTW